MQALRFSISLILIIGCVPAFAQQVRIDIETALALANKEEYVAALGMLAPCLKTTSPLKYSNLEDCLFHGDEITEEAVPPLAYRYEKETDYGRTGVRFQDWAGVVPYLQMGLDLRIGHYGGTIYQQEFLRHLKDLFPRSKYRDVYEYKLLKRGENDMAPVQTWIDALKSYRLEYPNEDTSSARHRTWQMPMMISGKYCVPILRASTMNISAWEIEKQIRSAQNGIVLWH